MLINSTICDVARKLGISEAVVTRTIEHWIATQVEWNDFVELKVLGIDEISLKRGHRDFVVIITTPTADGVDILGVLVDRQQQTVANFLKSIPTALRQSVERVCTDMYQGFVSAVREQLPQAKIVVDRFQVAKGYRYCADKVRQRELKRLRQELPKAEY